MSEPKRLTIQTIRECWGDARSGLLPQVMRSASEDIDTLLDHIAWQDGEIERLKTVESEFRRWREAGMLDLSAMPREKRPDLILAPEYYEKEE